MENASKALIIAGAILISILIVGLGVIIYNNVSDTARSSNLDEQEITAHNSPFESYFNNAVSGSSVKALLTKAIANNNSATSNDDEVGNYVFIEYSDSATATNGSIMDPTSVTSKIKSGKTYSVSIGSENNKYTDDFTKASGDTPASSDGAAYWKNGFIKTIFIKPAN